MATRARAIRPTSLRGLAGLREEFSEHRPEPGFARYTRGETITAGPSRCKPSDRFYEQIPVGHVEIKMAV